MATHTVRLHRVLRAPPDRVYRAFINAEAMAKWLPPNGFTGTVHHLDARVGGTFRMSFTNFTTGQSHSFGGEYLEMESWERLRYTDQFEDPNLPGIIQVTVEFRAAPCGTVRHRIERGAGGHSRDHSGRGVLPRLAGVARSPGQARRSRSPRVAPVRRTPGVRPMGSPRISIFPRKGSTT